MASQACPHDLLPASCTFCTPRPAEHHAGDRPRRRIRAQYAGRCAGCCEPILPGDDISPASGEDGWLCEECT